MRQAICNYPWPGNVRELRNAVERAVILATEALIAPANLPAQIIATARSRVPAAVLRPMR